ncbi:nucleotide-diphospho-sugar transferase [Cyathus striatus]|nr:nucleotide-diphospho-sugar transferase [Cyathus striatus]
MGSKSAVKEKILDDEEEVLQAVILADSFNKRFRPLTARKPRCLLPICNAPLLDWTFESLALAGVQEIFVVCRSHAGQVKNAIQESKWSKPGSGIKITPILTAKETFSPGDAMRDIYTRGLVTSDFILVMGDLVSNIRIDEVVRVHKERRKTNKDAIMTIVVKESGSTHRTRPVGDSSLFVLDTQTSECLHYEPVMGYPPTKTAHIPREILVEHPEVEIRNDLIDCGIDICSVEIPSLFQDNFDYLDIRRDFVHGILTSDLLMKNIHCYVAKEGYAARVKDTKSYDSISKDILSRWTFPLVPDDNHPAGHVYEYTRGNRYIAKDNTVSLARTCKIGTNTLVGSSTQISDNVEIVSSVIGRNCVIGPGTVINNSYIFDNTVVGSNCVIQRSIIGASAGIRDNTTIKAGCLIGDGVIVGPDVVLESFERLSVKKVHFPPNSDSEDEDSDLEFLESENVAVVLPNLGKDSNAISWPRNPPDDEDEDEESLENFKNQRFMRLGDDPCELYSSDPGSISSEDESEVSSDDDDEPHSIRSADFDTPLPLDLPTISGTGSLAESEFQAEVTQSLERAFAEGHSIDNASVELKTLRMASNVPLSRVREAVIRSIVEKIRIIEGGGKPQQIEIRTVIARWGELINRIGGIDGVETVSMLQAHCASSTRLPLFGQILLTMYNDDIVEEDDIRAWHKLTASKGDSQTDPNASNLKRCWSVGAVIIQQFDEQESDDSKDENDGGNSPVGKDTGSDNEDSEDTTSGSGEDEDGSSEEDSM